jgi:hypothetical protein
MSPAHKEKIGYYVYRQWEGKKKGRKKRTTKAQGGGVRFLVVASSFLPTFLPSPRFPGPSISRERGGREREREREREGEEPNGKVVSKKDPEPSSFR